LETLFRTGVSSYFLRPQKGFDDKKNEISAGDEVFEISHYNGKRLLDFVRNNNESDLTVFLLPLIHESLFVIIRELVANKLKYQK
jgi:hypothetical protein